MIKIVRIAEDYGIKVFDAAQVLPKVQFDPDLDKDIATAVYCEDVVSELHDDSITTPYVGNVSHYPFVCVVDNESCSETRYILKMCDDTLADITEDDMMKLTECQFNLQYMKG